MRVESVAMEVHAPDHPVLTFKQFLLHILIVTIGIIIAVSLEGAREWWHQRELVHHTRLNLRRELESNQKSVKMVLDAIGPARTRFETAIEAVDDVPGHTSQVASLFSPVGGGLMNGVSFAWLNTASYKTAQVTGAFGLMEYDEAFKYSDIYDLQEQYMPTQDAAQREMTAAYMLGAGLLTKVSPTEAADVERQLRLGFAAMLTMESQAKRLTELYERALRDE